MSDPTDPEAPRGLRPTPGEVDFDLDATLAGLVGVRTRIPEDTLSAETLGTERSGNGVVIDPAGLVLTIGYLVVDAEQAWIVTGEGRTVSAWVAGYDQETGFGLVRSLEPLGAPAVAFGDSDALLPDDPVIVAGVGGRDHAINARVATKREFAGYWEYVLDEAIFTAPPHPSWGGTALLGRDGRLLGIGSLLVQQSGESGSGNGANMMVPINLLRPILDDLRHQGRRQGPGRPWLGILVQDVGDRLVVGRVYDECPADQAGMRVGDAITAVAGEPVDELAALFRRIWSLGPAGTEVPLTLVRDGEQLDVVARSIDRNAAAGGPMSTAGSPTVH